VARVRKSRQKEAAGAADADLMQIEWSKGEVLKLAGVGTEVEEGARGGVERESMVENGVTEARSRDQVRSRADGGGAR
jgi:hypothetical protein